METSATTKALMPSNVRRVRKHNEYKPRTERMAYALAHPNMVEVADAELRSRLRSYQN